MYPMAGGSGRKQKKIVHFGLSGWICMQTMLKRTLCSNTYALTRGHRSLPKGSWTGECSSPARTCLSLDAGVEMEAAQAWEGPEGGKLVRRGNAHFKGQEGETVWWREEDGAGKKREEGRGLLCRIFTGDLGHFAHEHICDGASSSFPKQCQPD